MYITIDFTISPLQPATDILIAELSERGFESFLESDTGLQAFIQEALWKESMLSGLKVLRSEEFGITYSVTKLPLQNWNAEWEKSFSPVWIGEKCLVRAPFHPSAGLEYEIVIEPKMSFGTGHHETTSLMLHWLLELDVQGLSVLDIGCGTAVLAIMASLKGASYIDAIDNDAWSYENALENVARNGQEHIKVMQGDAGLLTPERYDVILANINRNILLADIPVYAESLKPGGVLLLSGFYLDDLSDISEKCRDHNLKFVKNTVKNQWVSAKYVF